MVSVVIPALDEARRLPCCLAAVVPEARAVGAEVLVVDGGSEDGTPEQARRFEVRVLASPPGRGVQMNAGAAAAAGSLLAFLPADTILPAGAIRLLDEIDRAGDPVAGGFRHRFDADRATLRWVSWAADRRARWLGLFYGDQVPFVRADLFRRLGGYVETGPMEDLELAVRLRRHCRPRQLPVRAITSSRRFDRGGDLATALDAVRLQLGWWLLGRAPASRRFFSEVR